MSRKLRIAELKAKLSEHLRYVRRGGVITVLDRDQPIARISPHRVSAERLVVRPASGKVPLGRISLPSRLPTSLDIVEILLADRNSGR